MYNCMNTEQLLSLECVCLAFYRCGLPTGVQADYDRDCTKLGNLSDPLLYNTSNVLVDIQDYYDRNLIDNPINIRNKRLYVFAGTRNELFTTGNERISIYLNNPAFSL